MVRALLIACLVLLGGTTGQGPNLQRHKGRHYTVRFDTPPDVARELSRHIDAMHEEYTRRFSAFGVRNARPMTVWVFARQADYLEFLAKQGHDVRNTSGVFFVSDDAQGIATYLEGQSERHVIATLQHEGFHLFSFLRIHEDLPIWADEGLAEFFEAGILVKGKMATGIAPPGNLRRVQEAIRSNEYLPLSDLFVMSHAEWNALTNAGDDRAILMYAQAWSVCHFLIVAENGKYLSVLMDYLNGIKRGMGPDIAMRQAVGEGGVRAMEEAWKKFILACEPDPLLQAVERLEFLGRGLLALHSMGVPVRSLDELRARLTAAGYASIVYSHGVMQRFDASDPRMFEAPPAQKRGVTSRIALADPPREGLPPEIRLTGLRVDVRITWTTDEYGEVIQRVVFE